MNTKKDFYILLAITFIFAALMFFIGRDLLSLWISLVCAYLLKRPYQHLTKKYLRSSMAATILVLIFFVAILALVLGIFPPMISEAYNFLSSLPDILAANQDTITGFIDNLSAKIPKNTVNDLIISAKQYLTLKSTDGVLYIINLVPVTFEIILYFILVPIMLFFLLKDGYIFCQYFRAMAPVSAAAVSDFWLELDQKLGSYLQGKVIEMLIVGIASLLLYSVFNLKFALLMAGIMAVSVLIPVIGAFLATLPLIFIAFWQFGANSHVILYLLISHGLLLVIDGNLLVPVLFSEKLCLHPLVILVGIILFGSIMGFWGLFFAIPLLIVLSLFIENFKNAFIGKKI